MTSEKRRVLILDDEPQTLKLLTDYLAAPQIDLVACSEIEAAECLMDRERFDVLVSDLEVSALGGLEGIRLIRHVACHFPRTSVIVFSGNINSQVRALGKALGVSDLLEKPAGLQQLRRLVEAGLAPRADRPVGEGGSVMRVETLDEVLRDRSIHAVLQPIMTLEPKPSAPRTFGVEGLSRGPADSPLRNPEILLDYASRKEKLFEIELQCIEAVLAESAHLEKVGKLFINVRPRSLSQPRFAPTLRDLVRRYGHHETDIVLELTEQQSILNLRAFDQTLETLREHGFGLALDDYGSGFANLHLIQQLPLDYLKIDGLFSSGIHRQPRKQAIVRSAVELAGELGISTIMERVETEEELEIVRDLGVTHAQGYYFSVPLPGRELAASFQPSVAGPEGRAAAESVEPASAGFVPPAGRATHELANLLTSITLFATHGMKALGAEDPLREDLEMIREAGEKAVALAHELQKGRPAAAPGGAGGSGDPAPVDEPSDPAV